MEFVHLAGTRHDLAERLGRRLGHFMPASLLDSQLETLEPLGSDEPGFVVDSALPVQEAVQQVLDWLDAHGTPPPPTEHRQRGASRTSGAPAGVYGPGATSCGVRRRCHNVPMGGNASSVELESARVVRLLRDSILSGQRRSGDRLIERDIADELAVSRLPVREAIRQLLSEGLLTARPRSWAVVRQFTEADVRDIAQVRDVLEVLVFELAALRHDSEGSRRSRRR